MANYQANLAGLSFRPAEVKEIVRKLDVGQELILERDPENSFDENAIKVLVRDTTISDDLVFIGFVEKLANPAIAADMDEGMTATATIRSTIDYEPTKLWFSCPFIMDIETTDE